MPSNRGGALANTYLLPQGQPLAQPTAPPQYVDEVGQPEENLQQIDGVTSDYFNKWSQLKGFALDVLQNYGIDVRYNDPSVPESNRLHRIYLKALSDLKQQGSKLKTSQSMLNASLQRGDLINADTRKQAFTDLQPGVDYVSHVIDPIVTEANNKLQQQYFDDKSLNEAKGYYEQIKAKLLKNADENPNQRQYWLRQVDGLTPPTSAMKLFAPYHDRGGAADTRKINAAGALLRHSTGLVNGTSETYKPSDTIVDENGDPLLVSYDTKGDSYGGLPTERWEYNPRTKQATIVTKDKDKLVRTPAQDVMSVTRQRVSENTRYDVPGEFFSAYAEQNNMFKPTGEFDYTSLEDPEGAKRLEGHSKAISEAQSTRQLADMKEKINQLKPSKISEGRFRDGRQTFTGADGRNIDVVVREGGTYEIENASDLTKGDKNPVAARAKLKRMAKTDLIKYLSRKGAHLQLKSPAQKLTPDQVLEEYRKRNPKK